MMARLLPIMVAAGLLPAGLLPADTANASPSTQARQSSTHARQAPAPARHAPARRAPAPAPYRWPLDGTPVVVRRFEPPPKPWLPGHRGVDLAAAPAAPVRSSGAGIVVFAGMVAGRPVVSVEHAGGLRTTYEPVAPGVRAGQRVEAGTVLGTLVPGHAGCPAACLHWGLRSGETYLDPLSLLSLGRVRLLPL